MFLVISERYLKECINDTNRNVCFLDGCAFIENERHPRSGLHPKRSSIVSETCVCISPAFSSMQYICILFSYTPSHSESESNLDEDKDFDNVVIDFNDRDVVSAALV